MKKNIFKYYFNKKNIMKLQQQIQQRKKNFDWVLQKISNSNYHFKDIDDLIELQNNFYTQSHDYNCFNKSKQLIQDGFRDQDEMISSINQYFINTPPSSQTKLNKTKKKCKDIDNNEIITFENSEYELWNLDIELQNSFIACILFELSDTFRILNIKQKKEYIKTLRHKMYIELTEKQLFTKFNYKGKVSKSHLESQLTNYTKMNEYGQRYVMDYFNLNVIVMNYETKKLTPYLQWYDDANRNIIIIGIKLMKPVIYLPMTHHLEFLENTNPIVMDMNKSKYFKLHFIKKLKSISSYKLAELQQMCTDLQISLFKIVNGKEKKKTKKDLHDNIKCYINN